MMEIKDDRRFHNLTQEQVATLDQVLTEAIPIHGRGNFPTLEIKPKDIIHVVRDRLVSKHIKVRDVRLNGSTASHVLVKENGTSYKDLDIIFGVELPKQEDFQIIKEVVLGCLLDFLPPEVNKDKITALTMKEAYVQKMVKVFTEHDRWSLISLCNNSGKNVELKFVSSLRRQFEFSVDSFQIILDTMLESYLEAERQEAAKKKQNALGILNEQIISAGKENCEQTDLNTLDESLSHDLVEHSDNEIIDKQNHKPSAEDTVSKMDQKVQSEALTVSAMSTAPVEDLSELFDAKTDQNNEDKKDKVHLESKATSETIDQSEAKLTDSKAHFQTEEGPENILAPHLVEPEPEHTSDAPEPIINPEPMILTDQCTFQPSHEGAVLLNQDSIHEFAAPPPAKKTSWTSQMVVLKHSSPKPPRKMSKKVTNASKEKLNLTDPKEVMPMQAELPGFTTNCLTSDSCDQKSILRLSDTTTAIIKDEENLMHSEETISICSSPEKTHLQTPEPETGETTNNAVVSPLMEPFNILLDMETEPETKTHSVLEKPVIQINSQTLAESEEAICSNSSCKDKSQNSAQTSDCPPESLDMPEPVTHTVVPEITHHELGLPECSTPCTPHCLPVESSKLASQLLEPLISTMQTEDFPNQSKLLSSLLEKEQCSVLPLESADGSTATSILTLPEVLPQALILKTSVETPQLGCPPTPPSQDPLIQPNTPAESTNIPESERRQQTGPPNEVPFVTVVAESMYGDFEQAMDHLRYRLIATRNPEEIRGGGLLKYSNLLVRDFKPASETEIKTLERYMCSRFFIDFPDVNEQQRKIESYLRNHFIGEEKSKYDYLMTLRRVVNESTVCLMGHERRQTLNMITILALKVLGEQNIIPNTNNVTCYYQPAPYMADPNFSNYYIANGQSPLIYHPYPLHIHMQTGLV